MARPLLLALGVLGACSSGAPPAGPQPAAPRDTSTVSVDAPSDPCTFTGRLRIRAVVYAGPTGDTAVAHLDGDPFDPATFVDATVTPPATADDRARIAITAPMPVDGWLDARARPLAVRERLDIIAGHLWLDATFEVTAFGPRDGTIEVAEPLPSTQGITAEPGGVFRRVDCADLALSTMAGFIGPTAAEGDTFVVIGADGVPVPVYDAPGGGEIAAVAGGSHMQVIERSGNWVRVTESEPVHVDVWVRAGDTSRSDSHKGVPGGVYLPDP